MLSLFSELILNLCFSLQFGILVFIAHKIVLFAWS